MTVGGYRSIGEDVNRHALKWCPHGAMPFFSMFRLVCP